MRKPFTTPAHILSACCKALILPLLFLLLSLDAEAVTCPGTSQGTGTTPSGCTSNTLSGGAGAYWSVTFTSGVYYTFTYAPSTNPQVGGFCIGGTNYTTTTTLNTLSGSVQIGFSSANSTWSGTSAGLTYVAATPTLGTYSGAGTYCGSATVAVGTSTNAGTGVYWQGTTSSPGTSTTTASSSQSVTSSGTYYFNADNGGCWSGVGAGQAVTITAQPAIGGLSSASPASGTTICVGYNSGTVTGAAGSGGTGSSDSWTYSINGGTSSSAYTNGTAITTTGGSTSVIVYATRSAGSGTGCVAAGPTAISTWPFGTAPVSPTLGTATPASGTSICTNFGNVSATITAGSGGSSGAADAYQYSINNGSSYATYTSGTNIPTTSATGSIIIQVQRTGGSYGCSNTGFVTIASWPIAASPAAPTLNVASPATGTTVCNNYGNVNATANAGTGGSSGASDSYQYSINNGGSYSTYTPGTNISTTSATGSIIVQSQRSAGSYGCTATGWVTIATWPIAAAVVAPTLNTATPTSGTSLCTNYGNVSASAHAGSGGSTGAADAYQYSVNGGSSYNAYTPGTNIPTSGATGSIIIQAERTGGSYGCSVVGWNTIASWTINPIPSPSFSPTPTTPVCSGVAETYTTQSGQSSYSWTGFGTAGTDYTLVSGGLSSTDYTATLKWISTGTKNISVSYSSSGCAATTPATATIVVNPSPTPTISTSGTGAGGCTGLSLTYTTQSGQSSYVWTIPGTAGVDYTLISGGTSTDNTLVLSYITAGSKTVTVNYNSATGGCPGLTPYSSTIVFHSSPTSAALASVIDPCNGGYAVQVTVSGGTSPFTFELTPPAAYHTLPSPAEVDAGGASSVTVSNITDANGCAPASTTGTNPVTFGSHGITPGGDSADCVVAASSTQLFFDHRAQLMASITAGSTALGSTGVITTIDGSGPLSFGPTDPQHYLQRHFQIVPTTSAAANVCLYISDAEANALNSISGSSDVHVAPEYYGTFPVSTSSNSAFGTGSRIMQYDGSSETPSSHSTETVITSITATHNPTVDGYTYSGVWQMCFNVSGFSGFYVYSASSLSGDNNALPVTLVSFTAQAVNNKFIQLDWITASEINNSGFQIERSTDGTNYQSIGWVEGHGNSDVQNEYQYSDLTAMPGIVYYYRLKQTDVDGKYAYTNIVSASLIGSKGFTVEGLYPNPANSQVSIGVISNISTSATVTITDMLGRNVLIQNWALSVGYNTNPFDVSLIANGTYMVTITSGDVRTSKQLVITR